jgi:hypothetical protein
VARARGEPGLIPIDRGRGRRQPRSMTNDPGQADLKWRPIIMLAIIVLALAAIAALSILGFALHILFSPWLVLAVAIVAFIKFRPRRSRP